MTVDDGVGGWGTVMMPAPVIGREPELARITELLERLGRGDGGTLLIHGPAGIGKTRLVESALALAAGRGIEVAHASADPAGTRRPFHVALAVAETLASADGASSRPDDGLRALLDATRRLRDPSSPAAPGSARVHVIEAIVTEVERRARTPLILLIDDLHFADDASIAALRALVPICAQVPLLIVATARPRPTNDVEGRLHDDLGRSGDVIGLTPLSDTSIAVLAEHLLAAPPAPALRKILASSDGNPLEVTELLRDLATNGSLRAEAGAVSVTADGRSRIRGEHVGRRLGGLDEAITEILRIAAVLGHAATVAELAALSGRRAVDLAATVDAALDTGILIDNGSRLRYAHDLVRDAVYERIPISTRSALHREAAKTLAVQGAPPVLVARHAALGSAPDEAVRWLRLAAEDVMSLAPESALEMLDEAQALAADDPDVHQAIQRARVDSLLGVGRLDDAVRLGELLCNSMEPGDARAELLVRLGGMLVVANRAADAVDHLGAATTEARRPALRALATAQHALARIAVVDLVEADSLARDAIALGETIGDSGSLVLAESVLARIPCFSHDYRNGAIHAQRAVEIAEDDPDGPGHDYLPWFWQGVIALDLDDHDTVDRAIREGRTRAADRHAAWADPLYSGLAASLHHRRGALDEAAAEAETGVSLSLDTGSTQALLWCQSIAALVAERRGEMDACQGWVDAAEATWATAGALLGVDHFTVASVLSLDRRDASTRLSDTWEMFGSMGMHNCRPLLTVPLIRAIFATDPQRADAATRVMEEVATTEVPGFEAIAQHARGIVDGNIDGLVEAAELFGRLGRRLDRAEALADAAREACRAGDPRLSRLLAQAAAALSSCDAQDAARRLINEVSSGAGQESTPVTAATPGGWETLTATEREVAMFVADGLTNSEIAAARYVSRRTIESHLVRVYAKLGHSSRTRLAVTARESGQVGPATG